MWWGLGRWGCVGLCGIGIGCVWVVCVEVGECWCCSLGVGVWV